MDTQQVVDDPRRIVRPAEAKRKLGYASRSSVYRLVDQGRLPPPIKVSPGAVGWRLQTLEDYLDERERESAGGDRAA